MKFHKKPVVIEAMQFDGTGESAERIAAWVGRGVADAKVVGGARKSTKPQRWVIDIRTVEGTMRADAHDWIICGIAGEFYPCKPDIFAATYEPGEPAAAPATERPR